MGATSDEHASFDRVIGDKPQLVSLPQQCQHRLREDRPSLFIQCEADVQSDSNENGRCCYDIGSPTTSMWKNSPRTRAVNKDRKRLSLSDWWASEGNTSSPESNASGDNLDALQSLLAVASPMRHGEAAMPMVIS